MPYVDKYLKYLEEIPSITRYSKEKNKSPVFGYTSNLDIVLKWDIKKYNEIIKKYLKADSYEVEGNCISNMEDFARISAYYIIRGLGGNFDITELNVCDNLTKKFEVEYSLGGTCAQGAAALGTMGIPVNVHLTDQSDKVCQMLDYEGTTAIDEGKIVPVVKKICTTSPIYHFIVQFEKDDVVIIDGKEFIIPLSNRLILFFDTVHKLVPLQKDFLHFWENCCENPSSYLISGFDAVVDECIMKNRLQELLPHIKKFKEKHEEAIIYFEGAFYMNPKVKEQALNGFGKYVDILGMNEEELSELIKRFGMCIDVSSLQQIVNGLDMLLEKYSPKGIVLHTKDYSMYYGKELLGIDIEKGLTLGNVMSATRARIGKYGTLQECSETLELPLSDVGIAFREEAEVMEAKHQLKIVPSRYMDHPKYTIGLGDTFVSGVHICFIK